MQSSTAPSAGWCVPAPATLQGLTVSAGKRWAAGYVVNLRVSRTLLGVPSSLTLTLVLNLPVTLTRTLITLILTLTLPLPLP